MLGASSQLPSRQVWQRWWYRGTVQGVGFRVTVQAIAATYPVCGFVQNQADGGVLVEVKGEIGVLSAFHAAIQQQLAHRIEDVTSTVLTGNDIPKTTETGFSIRH